MNAACVVIGAQNVVGAWVVADTSLVDRVCVVVGT